MTGRAWSETLPGPRFHQYTATVDQPPSLNDQAKVQLKNSHTRGMAGPTHSKAGVHDVGEAGAEGIGHRNRRTDRIVGCQLPLLQQNLLQGGVPQWQ